MITDFFFFEIRIFYEKIPFFSPRWASRSEIVIYYFVP